MNAEHQLAVPHIVRHHYMQQALAQGFPMLARAPGQRSDVLSIVGYGASLLETWRGIRGPVMTLSGAHRFLFERGIPIDYHADCDPRVHKAEFVRLPATGCTFLMASCCHPLTWQYLLGREIALWHKDNGWQTMGWLNDRGEAGEHRVIVRGCSIGIAALRLAKEALGFRKARLFGFDSCYSEDHALRAGPSDPMAEQPQLIEAGGKLYATTENMRRQTEEFEEAAAGLDYEIIGDGLLKALIAQKRERKAA